MKQISSDDWGFERCPKHFYTKEKPGYPLCYSNVEAMKELFSKLLLGKDVTGGCKGVQTALALSNAITHLASMFFFIKVLQSEWYLIQFEDFGIITSVLTTKLLGSCSFDFRRALEVGTFL